MTEKIKIHEAIVGKKLDKLPKIAKLPPEILGIIKDAKSNKLSIYAVRVILLIIANLKDRQLIKPYQLDLFNNEWFDVDNDNSYSVQLSFKFSDFLPAGNKNYAQIKKGLDELQELNQTIEFIKKENDGRERKFFLKSAFISSYLLEEGNGFKMVINNYWYRTLLNVTVSFNPYLKSIAYNISSLNVLMFYFYLKSLPIVNETKYKDLVGKVGESAIRLKGTTIFLKNFVKLFSASYKYESDIRKRLTDPIRAELNKHTDLSFNYKIENEKIYIVAYEVTSVLIDEKIYDLDLNKIRNAIKYKVERYNLGIVESNMLIEIYLKYTYSIVLKATDKKRALRDLFGKEYLDVFKALIEEYIKHNKSDVIGYSNTQEMRKILKAAYPL